MKSQFAAKFASMVKKYNPDSKWEMMDRFYSPAVKEHCSNFVTLMAQPNKTAEEQEEFCTSSRQIRVGTCLGFIVHAHMFVCMMLCFAQRQAYHVSNIHIFGFYCSHEDCFGSYDSVGR